ncbi:DJ-1/PfpI family protein [Xanthomonas bonasiae]|uniref:DJ-1/PfpI family protein n=1 Tax=Xanthomonas bonasiae TaxID=2810351 RepID=UPI00197E9B97|nr:DJ-1/PfpI family protein [Xanthomonas bonasiae]MBN6112001.1 DJ-1/PfpI family protein [Xanthomonas bonasiae]
MSHHPRRRSRMALFVVAGLFAVCGSIAAADSPATAQPENARATGLPIVHVRKHPDALPVVVVVAQDKAVLSDFVVPYGVLAQSGAATVIALNMTDRPLKAGPLTLLPDMTVSAFDKAYPDGADYVIVPATADKHAEETAWLRAQRAHGAALVSICDGVELLAEIGALDGRRATGHWASLRERRKHYRQVTWLTNLRYVADGDVASSTGVSAALPISLALVETIAGTQAARATAERLGVASWEAAHDSDMFKVLPTDQATHRANMRVEREDVVALEVRDGDDEVALSLHAEAWSRTMRNEVRIVSDTAGPVRLRGGLRVLTQAAASPTADVRIALAAAAPAGTALPAAFDLIAERYGSGTARLSALAMEYPWGDLKAAR